MTCMDETRRTNQCGVGIKRLHAFRTVSQRIEAKLGTDVVDRVHVPEFLIIALLSRGRGSTTVALRAEIYHMGVVVISMLPRHVGLTLQLWRSLGRWQLF